MWNEMLPNHRETIRRLSEHFQADPACLALLIGGSVAKQRARPDSDVDFMLIVTDENYARRRASQATHILTHHLSEAGFPADGPLEGKVFNWEYLPEAAEHGSEPTRFSIQVPF